MDTPEKPGSDSKDTVSSTSTADAEDSASKAPENTTGENPAKVSLIQTAGSILAAMFGVQSDKNRQRDFAKGDVGNFIGMYIVLAIVVIGSLIVLANLAASTAGK